MINVSLGWMAPGIGAPASSATELLGSTALPLDIVVGLLLAATAALVAGRYWGRLRRRAGS